MSGLNSITRSNVSAAVVCQNERSIGRQCEVSVEAMHFMEVVNCWEICARRKTHWRH